MPTFSFPYILEKYTSFSESILLNTYNNLYMKIPNNFKVYSYYVISKVTVLINHNSAVVVAIVLRLVP